MFKSEYLQKARRELFARGIWGSHARSLVEQLGDHYHETVEVLRAEGCDENTVHVKTAEMLGTPETVAQAAAGELRRQSVIGRHPWLSGAAMFIALAVSIPGVLFLGYHISGMREYTATRDVHALNFTAFSVFAFLANWLPFTLGILFLGWRAWKMPVGWKPLMIGCVAVGLATSALTTKIIPPSHGYGSGHLYVAGESWTAIVGVLVSPTVRHQLKTDPMVALNGYALVKLFLPLAACIALRRKLASLRTA